MVLVQNVASETMVIVKSPWTLDIASCKQVHKTITVIKIILVIVFKYSE